MRRNTFEILLIFRLPCYCTRFMRTYRGAETGKGKNREAVAFIVGDRGRLRRSREE